MTSDILFFVAFSHRNVPIFERVLTIDEKWVLCDTPKRSRHWLPPRDTGPHTSNPHLHKFMICISWTSGKLVHYELLQTGQTITVDLYSKYLERVQQALKQKDPALVKRQGVLFRNVNVNHKVVLILNENVVYRWGVLFLKENIVNRMSILILNENDVYRRGVLFLNENVVNRKGVLFLNAM